MGFHNIKTFVAADWIIDGAPAISLLTDVATYLLLIRRWATYTDVFIDLCACRAGGKCMHNERIAIVSR